MDISINSAQNNRPKENSQMEPDLLIIDTELLPVFNELASLMTDPDPATASQALEDLQDMVFDHTLRKLSKCQLKYFFYYLDDLANNLSHGLGQQQDHFLRF